MSLHSRGQGTHREACARPEIQELVFNLQFNLRNFTQKSKFPADAGFLCDKAALFWITTKWTSAYTRSVSDFSTLHQFCTQEANTLWFLVLWALQTAPSNVSVSIKKTTQLPNEPTRSFLVQDLACSIWNLLRQSWNSLLEPCNLSAFLQNPAIRQKLERAKSKYSKSIAWPWRWRQTIFQNVGNYSPSYTSLHSRRLERSITSPWNPPLSHRQIRFAYTSTPRFSMSSPPEVTQLVHVCTVLVFLSNTEAASVV